MVYTKSIYIFHRALRLDDNIGLIAALKESELVIPIFIFTPEQITSTNKYKSLFAVRFMIDALIDLDKSLNLLGSKLYIFYGEQHDVLHKILRQDTDIDAVFINKDYTPYAINREELLKNVTENENRTFESHEDYLLHDMDTIRNKGGSYYSVFTPFYHEAIKLNVKKPKNLKDKNFVKKKDNIVNQTTFDKMKIVSSCSNVQLYDFVATRYEGLKRIKDLKNHKNYSDDRDNLSLETTKLSPYIKFGIISMREVYHKILSLYGKNHTLIKQLYWREFYYNLSFNRLDILNDSKSFRESYDKIVWNKNAKTEKLLQLWKHGNTGYPVVDAGMRELNNTGYMHNRARLITSNFLVKHLFIDWREGEKYFASKLIDYDPSVNNGNWQFTSGSGADSQPYFRMMNPWLQEERHDKNCGYIKTWIPELINVPNEDVHNWQNVYKEYQDIGINYPGPCKIYDHTKLKKESKQIYAKAFK
jgi:deoxyribodipyrimidine photo-lyase